MAQRFRERRSARGFTLIELAVVGATISILMAIALPRITGTFKRVRFSEARSTLGALETSMRESWNRADKYPDSSDWNPPTVADSLPREMNPGVVGWPEISFKPEGSFRYRYRWTTVRDATAAKWTVTLDSQADTDNDGNVGRIVRVLENGFRFGDDVEEPD